MNAFLWLGAASTAVLVVSLVIDGWTDAFDALEIGGDWLSLPVLAAVVGAFGFGTGALHPAIGAPAVVIGIGAGALFGYLAVRLVRAVRGDDAVPAQPAAAMLGALGRIVTTPTATALGEVLVVRADGPTKVACRADRTIPLGTEVVIVDVTSSTLVTVSPFEEEP